MKPLAEIVSERLASNKALPGSIYSGNVEANADLREKWNQIVETNPGDLIFVG